jgi:DNA replication protein DnaC
VPVPNLEHANVFGMPGFLAIKTITDFEFTAQAGHRVAFAPATGWISRLAEAHSIGRLEAERRNISRYGLIVTDAVG